VNKFGFTGPFSDEMNDFILLKRSVGNKYEAEVGVRKQVRQVPGAQPSSHYPTFKRVRHRLVYKATA